MPATPSLQASLQALAEVLTSLSRTQNELFEKLQPVLIPNEPSPCLNETKATISPIMSELTSLVMSLGGEADRMITNCRDVTFRVNL